MLRRYTTDTRREIKVRTAYPLREIGQIRENTRGLRGKRKKLADKRITATVIAGLLHSLARTEGSPSRAPPPQ
jgi:hypothetical protein